LFSFNSPGVLVRPHKEVLNIYPNTEGQKASDFLEIGHTGSNETQFDPEVDREKKERMKKERKKKMKQ